MRKLVDELSAAALLVWKVVDCVVIHGPERVKLRVFTLAVANTDQYGNNAQIAPGARIDDGLLDLCAVPPLTVLNALPLLGRLFSGTLPKARGMERHCRDDVAYRVVTAKVVPDHATIARFLCRHERPLADLFASVLRLCARYVARLIRPQQRQTCAPH